MGRLSFRVLAFLYCAVTGVVTVRPAERVVDLTAADGTKLKASLLCRSEIWAWCAALASV